MSEIKKHFSSEIIKPVAKLKVFKEGHDDYNISIETCSFSCANIPLNENEIDRLINILEDIRLK